MAASEQEPITRVVFRTWRGKFAGDVIALFPDLPERNGLVTCYVHVGQHGAADWGIVYRQTRPATEAEYAPLLRELQQIGYRLQIRRRRPRPL